MYEFKDLTRLTTVATVAVGIYLLADFALTTASVTTTPSAEGEFGVVEWVALVQVAALFACFVIVGRWIYRASANAHAMSDQLDITPGWAVGWYFVPIANLFKPFQAMKEIWLACHPSSGGYDDKAPAILGWWWGLWLVSNFIGNVIFRMDMNGTADPQTMAGLYMLSTAINIPLCVLLIMIMREITNAQNGNIYEEIFA